MKVLKFGIRFNLLHPMMFIIFTFLRRIDSILIDKYINLNISLLLTFLMFLSEFISGLVLYLYHIKFLSSSKRSTFMGVKINRKSDDETHHDGKFKIFILIFIATFFDFNEFIINTFCLPKFNNISKSLNIRLRCILTISSGIFCYYLLRFPFFKHQKCSLFFILICLLCVIISEYSFEILYKNKIENDFNIILLLIFINHFLNSLKDIIEKYLLEFDSSNPFMLLMMEGLFGFIITFSFSFMRENFKEIKNIFNEKYFSNLIFLITSLILYFILSGGKNIYRMTTNNLYSPMTRTLADSVLDPLLIIYYYLFENDFDIGGNGKQNLLIFILNLFLSIIIVFCGCVYNELLVLYCCNLDYETYAEISNRATKIDKIYEESKEKDDEIWDLSEEYYTHITKEENLDIN